MVSILGNLLDVKLSKRAKPYGINLQGQSSLAQSFDLSHIRHETTTVPMGWEEISPGYLERTGLIKWERWHGIPYPTIRAGETYERDLPFIALEIKEVTKSSGNYDLYRVHDNNTVAAEFLARVLERVK